MLGSLRFKSFQQNFISSLEIYLFKGNKDLAEELLKEGYAVWVTGLAPDETVYAAAQEVAQDDRRGLWKAWLPSKGLQ